MNLGTGCSNHWFMTKILAKHTVEFHGYSFALYFGCLLASWFDYILPMVYPRVYYSTWNYNLTIMAAGTIAFSLNTWKHSKYIAAFFYKSQNLKVMNKQTFEKAERLQNRIQKLQQVIDGINQNNYISCFNTSETAVFPHQDVQIEPGTAHLITGALKAELFTLEEEFEEL